MATASEDAKQEETKINESEDVKEAKQASEPSVTSDGAANGDAALTKSSEEAEVVSDETLKAVAERLQFFFGNANLRKDNFLRKRLADNNNRIDVDTLLKFNSIKALTTSADTVVNAARTLDAFLTVSDDSKHIGRVEPFGEQHMDGHVPLTLFLKNIPFEGGTYKISVQEIRDFFEPYGEVALVKLGYSNSKHKGRKPKGTCMVEFATQDMAEAAAAAVATIPKVVPPPEKKLMVGDQQVDILLLKDHVDTSAAADAKDKGGDGKHGNDEDDDADDDDDEVAFDWKNGSVISIMGLAADCDREAILDSVAKALNGTVEEIKPTVYVDYSRGQPTGAVRFDDPKEGQVADVCQKLASGELEIAGAKVESAKVLEGDEEETYWKNFIAFKKKQRRNHRHDSGRKNSNKRRRHH